MKGSGKYLRELSVIMIGIAITFAASNWISDRSVKNDLDTVKLELKDSHRLGAKYLGMLFYSRANKKGK